MRRPFAILVVLAAVGALTGSAGARRLAPAGPNASFVVTGHGWGHGVGMSQYGAYGYAQHGFGYAKIVAHYFPGTQLGPAPVAKVRVLVAAGTRTLTLTSPADFKVRDGNGKTHDVAAGKYALTPALKLEFDAADKPKPLKPPLLFQPGGAPLHLGRRYRGSIQVDIASGALRAVNVVGLEQYLYGVVPSEMPFTWLRPRAAGDDGRGRCDGRKGLALRRPGGEDILLLDVRRANCIGARRVGHADPVPRVRARPVRLDLAVPHVGPGRLYGSAAREGARSG